MPALAVQDVFDQYIPPELKANYFPTGLPAALKDINQLFYQQTEDLQLQALLIVNFMPNYYPDQQLLDWMVSLSISPEKLHLLVPYLQRKTLIFQYFAHLQDLIQVTQTDQDNYLFYFLHYQQIELMSCVLVEQVDWVEKNHAYLIEFCLTTTEKKWLELFIPCISPQTLNHYFNLHPHWFEEKCQVPGFSFFVQQLQFSHADFLSKFLFAHHFGFFNTLIQKGMMDFLKNIFCFLEDRYQKIYPRLDLFRMFLHSKNFRVIHVAARFGQEAFFQWVFEKQSDELSDIICSTKGLALKIAIAHHHTNLFKLLLRHVLYRQNNSNDVLESRLDDFDGQDYSGSLLNIALFVGNVEALEIIYSFMCQFKTPEQLFFENEVDLFESAVEGGQLASCQWLLEKMHIKFPEENAFNRIIENNGYSIILEAAQNGNRLILDFLTQHLDLTVLRASFVKMKYLYQHDEKALQKVSVPVLNWLAQIFSKLQMKEILQENGFSSLIYSIQLRCFDSTVLILNLLECKVTQLPYRVRMNALREALLVENIVFLNYLANQFSHQTIQEMIHGFSKKFIHQLGASSHSHALEWLQSYHFHPDSPSLRVAKQEKSSLQTLLADLNYTTLKSLDRKRFLSVVKYQDFQALINFTEKGDLASLQYIHSREPKLFYQALFKKHDELLDSAILFEEYQIFKFFKSNLRASFNLLQIDSEALMVESLYSMMQYEKFSLLMWCLATQVINPDAMSSAGFEKLWQSIMKITSKRQIEFIVPFIVKRLKENVEPIFEWMYRHSMLNHNFLRIFWQDMDIWLTYERFFYQRQPRSQVHLDFLAAEVYSALRQLLFQGLNDNNFLQGFHFIRYAIEHTKHHSLVLWVIAHPSFAIRAHYYNNYLLRMALKMHDQEIIESLLMHEQVKSLAQQHQFYISEQPLDTGQESAMQSLSFFQLQNFGSAINYYRGRFNVAEVFNGLKMKLTAAYQNAPALIQRENNALILPLKYADFDALQLPENFKQQALIAYYQHTVHTAWRFLSMPNHWIDQNMSSELLHLDENGQRSAAFQHFIPLIALLYFAAIDENIQPIEGHTFESRWQHFYCELALAGRAHNVEKKEAIMQPDGCVLEREVDDLEADKPTCSRGIFRHLSQAVLGHPLFTQLSYSMVQQELNAWVYAYYNQLIEASEIFEYQQAFEHYCSELDESSFAILKRLDIPLAKQETFINNMKTQFQHQFHAEYEKKVRTAFSVGEKDAHAIQFYSVALKMVLHKRKSTEEAVESAKKVCK